MHYEDFELNKTLTTDQRKMNIEDIDVFLKLVGLENPIFTSTEGAATAGHTGRIVPAPFQLSIAMGLAQKAGIFDHVIAVLEFNTMKFHRTVHPGDTLTLKATPIHKRKTSKPERGLVVLEYRLLDQNQETIMTSKATYLMGRRPVVGS